MDDNDAHGGEGGGRRFPTLIDLGGPSPRPQWIPVAAASPAEGHEAAVNPRRVFTQVILGALAILVAVALVGAPGIATTGRGSQSVHDAARTTDLFADTVVQPALADALLERDASRPSRRWIETIPVHAPGGAGAWSGSE